MRLALYPLDLFGEEAAPGCAAPLTAWSGVTLAVNVASREDVDALHRSAVAAGARAVSPPGDRA